MTGAWDARALASSVSMRLKISSRWYASSISPFCTSMTTKADQAQEEEFHAEESGAPPTGSSARGESGQLDGHGPPGTEPDQRERAIALAEALSSEYPQRPPPAPRLPPGQFRLAKNGSPAPGRGPAAIVARPAPVHRPTTGADPAC